MKLIIIILSVIAVIAIAFTGWVVYANVSGPDVTDVKNTYSECMEKYQGKIKCGYMNGE